MKKIISLIIIITVTMLITGCNSNENETKYKQGTLICSREGNITNGSTNLEYLINYKDGNIITLHSIEEVVSDDEEILDTYENAYKNIFKAYENLKYYENTVVRDSTSVVSNTIINYDKVDINALLAIEGAEDNIIQDGKTPVQFSGYFRPCYMEGLIFQGPYTLKTA